MTISSGINEANPLNGAGVGGVGSNLESIDPNAIQTQTIDNTSNPTQNTEKLSIPEQPKSLADRILHSLNNLTGDMSKNFNKVNNVIDSPKDLTTNKEIFEIHGAISMLSLYASILSSSTKKITDNINTIVKTQ